MKFQETSISIAMPTELREEFKHWCEAHRTTMSREVRKMVEERLNDKEVERGK